MNKKILLLIFVFSFLLVSCSSTSSLEVIETNIKVYVDSKGEITADGKKISLEELDMAFEAIKDQNGAVYYSREDMYSDTSNESMKIIELVAEYELPLKFFTDETFTTPYTPTK